MSEFEIRELQERIDAGILLAQRRLIERTRRDNGDLVVVRDGEVVRLTPDELLQPAQYSLYIFRCKSVFLATAYPLVSITQQPR